AALVIVLPLIAAPCPAQADGTAARAADAVRPFRWWKAEANLDALPQFVTQATLRRGERRGLHRPGGWETRAGLESAPPSAIDGMRAPTDSGKILAPDHEHGADLGSFKRPNGRQEAQHGRSLRIPRCAPERGSCVFRPRREADDRGRPAHERLQAPEQCVRAGAA